MAEANSRPLLPQTTQAQSYSFAPQVLAPREPQQRNYVFVDEHNRHKRLKVMRACEGCRRRKIKCDSATTNSWPCGACTRLKLNCVPPTVSYEKDSTTPGVHTFDVHQRNDYPTIPVGNISDYHRQPQIPQPQYASVGAPIPTQVQVPYSEPLQVYPPTSYVPPTTQQDVLHYSSMPPNPMPGHDINRYQDPYATPATARPSTASDAAWKSDMSSSSGTLADGLSEAMGELKIDHLGISPYIADRKKLAEAPAVEEIVFNIPHDSGPDARLRIPPEMMPSDELAMQYFDYFFANIHPYVPVLNRTSFYHQWNTNRESISPLLLEAIFACSAMMLDDHTRGQKFLALASKHEESFKDVPRLSTVQALLLLLKARESAPKRGYFYRSWMTLVNIVAMAKDLELDQHLELHMSGQACDSSSSYECVCKTRCWQLMYVLEAMIGGPQGRLEFGVNEETVDFSPPQALPGIDESDLQLSRGMLLFTKVVKNIRESMSLYAKLRKTKKDWMVDPEFTNHDQDFHQLLRDLPRDMQVSFPPDGSSPYISSSFIANIHCYYYLSIILHQRPQLRFLEESPDGISLKQHMIICHDAAKKLCRIQESIMQSFGLPGLVVMQRGVSFTIYCILTCTMLHLASITSPFPELNGEARDYFVRHMRILEQVAPSWPMPEVQAQINSLREAFSADTSKPFELKPNFPFGSPASNPNVSPVDGGTFRNHPSGQDLSLEPPTGQVNYNIIHPITPPISATDDESKTDSPVVQSLAMMASSRGPPHHNPNQQAAVQSQESLQQAWNPSRLFDQWNVAFGTPPPSSTASQSSPPLNAPQPGTYDLRVASQELNPQAAYSPQAQAGSYSPHASNHPQMTQALPAPPQTSYPGPTSGYVTPAMWQDVVASSFGDGLKRRWDYGTQAALGQMAKRQR